MADRDSDNGEGTEDTATVPPSSAGAPTATRRTFLDAAIVGGGAMVGLASTYPAVRFLEPVGGGAAAFSVVGQVGDFPAGSARSALLGDLPVLVVRDKEGAFRAFVAICPHLQCVVRYSQPHEAIECACHGGRFNLGGSPVAGPPKRPLEVLRVNVVGNDVVVTRA